MEREIIDSVIHGKGSQALADKSFDLASRLMDKIIENFRGKSPEYHTKKGMKFLQKLDKRTGLPRLY